MASNRTLLSTFLVVVALCAASLAQTTIRIEPPCGPPLNNAARQINGLALAADFSGNVFVADTEQSVVFRLSPSGTFSPFAGNGAVGFAGDGGPAISATLGYVNSIATDAMGNLFIGENGSPRIRRVTPAGIITTVAGNGALGISGDGGLALAAPLCPAIGLAVDSLQNLFIATGTGSSADGFALGDYRILRVAANGSITTIAGTGLVPNYGQGYRGDNQPLDGSIATSGAIFPTQIVADLVGNLLVADGQGRIRRIAPSGVITTVAGILAPPIGSPETPLGDGGPAISATLGAVMGLALDRLGNIFIATNQPGGRRIRKVDLSGNIQTFAGGVSGGVQGDGGAATSATLAIAGGRGSGNRIAVDGAGNLFIAERQRIDGVSTDRIRKVTPKGIISTVVTFP